MLVYFQKVKVLVRVLIILTAGVIGGWAGYLIATGG